MKAHTHMPESVADNLIQELQKFRFLFFCCAGRWIIYYRHL